MSFYKKHIITGAPGTGKSTLIQALENKEISIMSEVSRDIIKLQQVTGGKATPWEDVLSYAFLVFKETKKRLKQHPKALFTDRSLIDVIAYLEYYKVKVPQEILDFPFLKYYHSKVFFTPTWEAIYKIDLQRPQSFKELNGLDTTLWTVYEKLGFSCVLLPKSDVATRLDFVLNKI